MSKLHTRNLVSVRCFKSTKNYVYTLARGLINNNELLTINYSGSTHYEVQWSAKNQKPGFFAFI